MGACLPVFETGPFLPEQREPGRGQVPGQGWCGRAALMGAAVSGRSTAPQSGLSGASRAGLSLQCQGCMAGPQDRKTPHVAVRVLALGWLYGGFMDGP